MSLTIHIERVALALKKVEEQIFKRAKQTTYRGPHKFMITFMRGLNGRSKSSRTTKSLRASSSQLKQANWVTRYRKMVKMIAACTSHHHVTIPVKKARRRRKKNALICHQQSRSRTS